MPMEIGLRQVRLGNLKLPGETGLQESDYLDRMPMPGRDPIQDQGTEEVQLISLGCYCAPKLSFKAIGRGSETLPFDWMRTRLDGLLHFMRNDFADFFDDFATVHLVPNSKMTIYRGFQHSFWHDNPVDPAMQERYLRRIARFKAVNAYSSRVLFVRSCSDSDELARAVELLDLLKENHGPLACLLMIIDFQTTANGPATIEGHNNLLVYYMDKEAHNNPDGAPYCDAVRTGLDWVVGRPVSAMQFVDLETIVDCTDPTSWGNDGMNGVPSYEEAPMLEPRLLTDRLEANMKERYTVGVGDGVILASLSCTSDAKRTFQRMGRGADMLPFDWVRVTHAGLIHFLRNDFSDFFTYSAKSDVPNTRMTAYRSRYHSFWYDNPDLPETRAGYAKRIANFNSLGNRGQPILFVRAVTSKDELAHADELLTALKDKFGDLACLLVIVDFQTSVLGPIFVETHEDLMVYLLHGNAREGSGAVQPYREPVEHAIRWAGGGVLGAACVPNLQAVCAIADATRWGHEGYGGVDAFDADTQDDSSGEGSSTTASSAPKKRSDSSADCCHGGLWKTLRKLVGR